MSRIVFIILIMLIGIWSADADTAQATLTLINKFRMALAYPLSDKALGMAEVPTLGCPQDGQVGPEEAPTLPKRVRVLMPRRMAPLLNYYSAGRDPSSGVLAPRGWDCFGTYGSGGSTLYVVPRRLGDPIADRPDKIKDGPAVIKRISIGDTSGRFTVARISARIFPGARAFVERVRGEGIDDPADYVFEPWRADMLTRLSDFGVSYVTPSGLVGLGTAFGLAPAKEPISGLVFLTGIRGDAGGPLLHALAVRLEPSEQFLYAAIGVATIASMDSVLEKK